MQERDSYKSKVHRLNHALTALLKSEGYKTIDLDWILAENLFLKESLAQLQEEKHHANEMGKRYKAALEKSSHHGTKSSDLNSSKLEKDLQKLMKDTSFPCPLQYDLKSTESLVELCTAALETVNDRMLQLKHQRKANKHIAAKLKEIEDKIREDEGENGDLILHPSEFLMRNYSKADVDEGNDIGEDLIPRIPGCFSNSSTTASRPSTSRQSTSSDFVAQVWEVSSSSEEYVKQQVCNPPDIIVQGIPRIEAEPVEPHPEVEPIKPPLEAEPVKPQFEAEPEKPPEEVDEDAIVLPDHLKDLVEAAMRSLEEQNSN